MQISNAVQQLEDKLPDRAVSSAEAMSALVRCDGDLLEASVTLKTKASNILIALVQDQNNADMLAGYLRTFMTLKTMSAISEMHTRVMQGMDDLNPRDLTSAYTKLLDVFGRLTEGADANANAQGNPFDLMLRSMPPNVRAAMLKLANSGSGSGATGNSGNKQAVG